MKLPLQFKAQAQSAAGIQKNWSIESYGHVALCAVPSEFGGPGGGFSPEDLFAQALTNCFLATFKVYAENSKLIFSNIQVETNLTVAMNDHKKVTMQKCHFNLNLYQTTQPEKAKLSLKKLLNQDLFLIQSKLN